MITIERTVDISKPVQTETLRGNEFTGEQLAHTFKIHVTRDGVAVPLTGTVTARFFQANGASLLLAETCGLEDGAATVTLVKACYDIPGRFALAIYHTENGEVTCIYSAVGAVVNVIGDPEYDPGNVIGDISTLIDTANQAAEDAQSALAQATNIVSYAEQTGKTDAEKAQARTNIGAVSEAELQAAMDEHFPATGKLQAGVGTSAAANGAVATGVGTTASGRASHAEGQLTTADGQVSHAEGYGTTASGDYSHAEGFGTKASGDHQHAFGKYNVEDTNDTYLEIAGNGTGDNARSNARTLDWNGNEALAGDLTVNKGGAGEMVLGQEVSSLKSAIKTITGNEEIKNFISNKYIDLSGETANINSATSNQTYLYIVLDCTAGDIFTITGTGGHVPRLYAFLGAESNGTRPVLQKADAGVRFVNRYITAPQNAEKLVVNINKNYSYSLLSGKRIFNVWTDVAENADAIEKIQIVITFPNLTNPENYNVGYLTNAGATGSNTRYKYTGAIPVSYGETVYFTSPCRYVCAYTSTGSVNSSAGIDESEIYQYVVPENIASIRVTFYTSDESTFMATKVYGQNYIPYGTPIINKNSLPDVEMPAPVLNYYRESGSLSANEHLIIEKRIPIKNESVVQFSGNVVGDFTGLEFGFTNNISSTDTTHFKIDATKYYRITSNPTESEHNLTISGNLSITLTQTYTHLLIDIVCNGQKYHTSSGWSPINAYFYVKAISAMDDCVLSLTAVKNKKTVAVFGDSYVSYGNDRWPYYMIEPGYDKHVTIIGYSGENSQYGYENFEAFMPITDAKYVVWAYGMNDQDSASAINATWKAKIDAVIAYCVSKNIVPVLCTVPNVPSRNNNLKNAYVRSFIGTYPVIDFAKAVGSDVSSAWYDGMLSSDNVHPTESGAMALYNRAIADFPQLCVDA